MTTFEARLCLRNPESYTAHLLDITQDVYCLGVGLRVTVQHALRLIEKVEQIRNYLFDILDIEPEW
jgi:hypothetical protein